MKRKRFSEEQIVRIPRQAERPEQTVAAVCKEQGISEQTWYREKDDSAMIDRLQKIAKACKGESGRKACRKLRR